MSQVPPNNQFESIIAAQHDADVVYENVTKHLEEIYPLPKKFIEQTAPVVDKYLKEFSDPGSNNGNYFVFQAIMGFMQQFDDFALMTNKIFSDYRLTSDNYKVCLDRLSHLSDKNPTGMNNEPSNNLEQLAPELVEICNRLQSVKERSEEMVKRLEKMESRWNKIRSRIKE